MDKLLISTIIILTVVIAFTIWYYLAVIKPEDKRIKNEKDQLDIRNF